MFTLTKEAPCARRGAQLRESRWINALCCSFYVMDNGSVTAQRSTSHRETKIPRRQARFLSRMFTRAKYASSASFRVTRKTLKLLRHSPRLYPLVPAAQFSQSGISLSIANCQQRMQ